MKRGDTLRSDMMEYLMQMLGNVDMPTVGGGSAAAALAAVWYFARVIRKVVSVAFSLCVVYVLLRIAGVDMSGVTELLGRLFAQG